MINKDNLILDTLYAIGQSEGVFERGPAKKRLESIFDRTKRSLLMTTRPTFAQRTLEAVGTPGEWILEPADLIVWLKPAPSDFRSREIGGVLRKEVKVTGSTYNYIFNSVDFESWPPAFIEALSSDFALQLVHRLPATTRASIKERYEIAMNALRIFINSERRLVLRTNCIGDRGWY